MQKYLECQKICYKFINSCCTSTIKYRKWHIKWIQYSRLQWRQCTSFVRRCERYSLRIFLQFNQPNVRFPDLACLWNLFIVRRMIFWQVTPKRTKVDSRVNYEDAVASRVGRVHCLALCFDRSIIGMIRMVFSVFASTSSCQGINLYDNRNFPVTH